jgi:hypothetical protein
MNFCRCKQCKKQRRKGKILGSRVMSFWLEWNGAYVYNKDLSVSDYVPFPKFMKGRKRKEKNQRIGID